MDVHVTGHGRPPHPARAHQRPLPSMNPPLLPPRPYALLLAFVLFVAGCASSGPAAQPDDEADAEAADTTVAAADTSEVAEPPPVPVALRRTPAPSPIATADGDTVRAGRFDQGKMWTFDNPPIGYFEEEYGFSPDSAWFRQARLGALRIPGCSASFVSPAGLVMTNHHCGRSYASQVSREGENLLDNGFVAASLDAERPVEGLYADQLIAIEDVTEEVYATLDSAQTDAERADVRQATFERISNRIAEETGAAEADVEADDLEVEVISLYNGGQYAAYVFRRYGDVRLVMIPELQLGYFGGDTDNFTYPRYALDMAFFRVYGEGGEPFETENYFAWSEEGASEGEAVFVVGNPGSTDRLGTVSQLEFSRDVEEPVILDFYTSRAEALRAYSEENPEEAEARGYRNLIFSLLNAQKLYRGRVEAVGRPDVQARRQDAERQFQAAIEADDALQTEYGGRIAEMADVQAERRELAADFEAFIGLQPGSRLASETLQRALVASSALRAGQSLEDVRQDLLAIEDQPAGVDRRFMAARFEDFIDAFGEDDEVVQDVLDGRPTEEAAQEIVENSALADSASVAEALEAGTSLADDPAIEVIEAIQERYGAYQSASAGLAARQEEIGSALGRARYAVYGTDVPPDATFSLRIADGVVQGYEYNGTVAPPFTNFLGLYDHYHSYGPETEWDLPERWLERRQALDLSTPLNLVSTNDIIGGNSGSPLLNQDLEIVGLVFDGNIESLGSNFIFLTNRARAVSVDARGMLEALDAVYDTDRIVLELTAGTLVPSEEEADAVLGG